MQVGNLIFVVILLVGEDSEIVEDMVEETLVLATNAVVDIGKTLCVLLASSMFLSSVPSSFLIIFKFP